MITPLYTASADPPDVVPGPDGAGVDAICRRWSRAVAARDRRRVEALLSSRCVLIPPGGDSVKGPAAVAEAWERIFSLPGFHLTIEPDRINLYSTGGIAHDIGRYRLSFHADAEARRCVHDHGSHLLVWEQTNDDWRVRSEVFFSQSFDGARLLDGSPGYASSADGKST